VEHPRWIEVNLTTAVAESPAEETTPPTEEPAAKEDEGEGDEEDERYRQVRSRVQMLKRLREDGLLSEEQYERELDRVLSQGTAPPE
jgi:hypothetical protein